MGIDSKLLEILACPKCKGGLVYQEEKKRFVCNPCMLAYPVRYGVPVMLIDEAEVLEPV